MIDNSFEPKIIKPNEYKTDCHCVMRYNNAELMTHAVDATFKQNTKNWMTDIIHDRCDWQVDGDLFIAYLFI